MKEWLKVRVVSFPSHNTFFFLVFKPHTQKFIDNTISRKYNIDNTNSDTDALAKKTII